LRLPYATNVVPAIEINLGILLHVVGHQVIFPTISVMNFFSPDVESERLLAGCGNNNDRSSAAGRQYVDGQR